MSLEEDRKLLEAVVNYRPPETLHPISMQAWNLYEAGGHKLSDASLQQLRDTLDGFRDDLEALSAAWFGLVRFLIHVTQNLDDQETGEKVTALLNEFLEPFKPFWDQVGQAMANLGIAAESTFESFSGRGPEIEKAAPEVGKENAPPGSVQLKNLVSPARPPPWANKKK